LGWLGNILFTSWQLESLNEKQDDIDIHADFTQLMSLSVLKHFLSFKQKSFTNPNLCVSFLIRLNTAVLKDGILPLPPRVCVAVLVLPLGALANYGFGYALHACMNV